MEQELLKRIADVADRGEAAVLVTLVAVDGPAPRAPGARMLVFPDGRTEGTIGGGSLEAHAVERAQDVLSKGGTELETLDLTDRGLKCGRGKATLFYEVLAPEPQLAIFGAGHVGRSLAELAQKTAAFPVALYVGRGEGSPEVSPSIAVRPVPGFREIPALPAPACAVICTDSHATDLDVARQILRQAPGPAYLGMLGSKTKSAEIRAQLEADGIAPERVAAVHCPVGLPLGGRSPGLVALSILAEVVAFHHGRLSDAQARMEGRGR